MKKVTQLFVGNSNSSMDWLLNLTRTVLCLMVLTAGSAYAQDPAQYGTPYTGVPDARDANIYQVHIRPHSAAGNLASVTSDLDRIKSLGINVLYLMPIYPYGTDSRSTNSPYCIKDYKAVGSEYGTLTDMRNLVAAAHSKGMAVMLDIAVNGTSWDHPWITQHPEYYGGTPQQLANFSDIAALDLNNAGLRAAMKDAMRYWIFAANIDGYRCDFANNPPLDFWSEIIGNLRGITSHNLLMLAEGDRLQNFQAGFDMNFGDKWFYDALKNVAGGGPVSTRFQTTNDMEYQYATGSQQEVRWTANHDSENNSDTAPFTVFKNNAGVVANFLVSGYMKGVPFLTSGQEVAFNQVIPWPYTGVKINWSNTGATQEFAKILNYRNSSAAIRRGVMTPYASDDICAFTKTLGSEKVVVMTNLRNASKTFVIPAGFPGSYKDAFTGATVNLTAGATQSFAAFQYIVLTNTNVATVAVTGVSVSPNSATVGLGATQQLSATITPANATNQSVTWTSSNTAVANVNASGVVTGVATGTSTITAKTADGNKTATAAITVSAIAVTGVSVSPNSASLFAGATQQLSATISPANASNKTVSWVSNNNGVATVNASGLVTAVAAGNANITVSSQDGNKSAVATITVKANSSFTVNFYKPSNFGTTIKIYYWSALPAGKLADASWPGANMTNAGNGWYSYTFTNITSTNLIFNDGTNQTANLSRNKTGWFMNGTWYDSNPGTNVSVTGVILNPTSTTLNVGATQQLTSTVSPANATNKTVSYGSNNTGVATVNNSGVVTAVANGTATITVTTADGNKKATCAITVSTTNGGTYYTIKNRWTNNYLYDAGANVGYGSTVANNSYKWQKVATDGTYFVLKNLATGEIMHIENQTGSVQANGINSTWWSAQWSSDNVDGTWVRIRNRWQNGSIIHVENQTGSAQYANAQEGWFSAQWKFEINSTSKINDEKPEINFENNNQVVIYPNPAINNEFNIDLPKLKVGEITTVIVTDLNGRKALETKITSSSKINHNLSRGIYTVTINSDSFNATKKLIIK